MTIKEMREKKAKAISDARSIMSAADAENRSMTDDESTRFDAFMSEAETVGTQITQREQLEDAERSLSESQGRKTRDAMRPSTDDALRGWLLLGSDVRPSDAQMRAVTDAGLTGKTLSISLRSDPLTIHDEYREWANRAQSVGTGSAGGFTVAQGFVNQVERALLAFGGARQAARVMRTAQGNDLPWPLSDDTSNEATLIAENTEMTEQDVVFGSKTLKAFKFTSGLVKVSTELLEDSAVNIAEVVGSMLGERVARGTNKYFTTGTGTSQPEGVVTGATLGVTGTSTTAITYDELVDLEHSVDAAYRANAVFMMADTTLRDLKKLKDSNNDPIWIANIANGAPSTILGHPYIINNNMDAMGAGKKAVLFGDFSRFIIRDAGPLVLVRLDERYAELGQVAFVVLSRSDSRVLDAGTHPIKYFANAAA